ncbi:hypothetical protein TWF730_009337 [Orbilia blumenaviensis]|uniref:Heterokaryon incompatibility domain-containing protein n=1 Tax=Orbilia blumenaviensis TaxID=1796055 RepID=A0AAV9V1Z9_9PEZI
MSTLDSASSSLFRPPKWLGFLHANYPISPFSSYLETRDLTLSSPGPPNLLSKLQSWLTFGVLECVTQSPIDESLLILTDSDSLPVLSRSNIPTIMSSWVERIKNGRSDEYRAWSKRVNSTLGQLRSIMITMLAKRTFYSNPSILSYEDATAMILTIGCIAEAIVATKMAFHPSVAEPMGFSWSTLWIPEYRRIYEKELVDERGWCRFTVSSVIGSLGLCGLEYLSRLRFSGEKHKACTDDICQANMVDVDNYKPKHTNGCDQGVCIYSKPNAEMVVDELKAGNIPIMVIEGDDIQKGGRTVEIMTAKSDEIPYLAISHVWADGLGSTTEDGLPTCQIRRIANLVATVLPKATGNETPKLAFWMDSLCIPNNSSVRKKAIGLMARTYTEAEAVLVLDSAILSIPSTLPREALAVHILTSGWMRRLWTLQEAVLAKKLFFLCGDGHVVQLADVIPAPDNMLLYPEQTDIASELFRLTKWRLYNTYTIGDVARALRWRATSRASDETLAIASLLGKDPASLAGLPPETRMKELLLRLKEVPRNILFLSASKMDIDGFRWAPISLMATHGGAKGGSQVATQTVKDGGRMCTVTEDGLNGLYYAILFPLATLQFDKTWGLIDRKGSRYYLITEPDKQDEEDYQCNLILLDEAIQRGGAVKGIAALRIIDDKSQQEQRPVCRYRRRLVMRDYPEVDFKKVAAKGITIIDISTVGLINIRVT